MNVTYKKLDSGVQDIILNGEKIGSCWKRGNLWVTYVEDELKTAKTKEIITKRILQTLGHLL